MTYCVGLRLKDGLVLITDSRTNAGIDNIASYRKLHVFEQPGERLIAVATSGNLSISQSVISMLTDGLAHPETGDVETLMNVPSMFRAAQLVGRAVRDTFAVDGKALEQHHAGFDVALLVAGQIKGGRMRLFMVYAAGNFIEATEDTPFLQIGEHKYGKPILDRAVSYQSDLYDGLKIGLISMDSTMRSNLAVGLPLDVLVLKRDEMKAELSYRVTDQDAYFADLRQRWSKALREAHLAIPPPPYRSGN